MDTISRKLYTKPMKLKLTNSVNFENVKSSYALLKTWHKDHYHYQIIYGHFYNSDSYFTYMKVICGGSGMILSSITNDYFRARCDRLVTDDNGEYVFKDTYDEILEIKRMLNNELGIIH